jgi:hypothetical protein
MDEKDFVDVFPSHHARKPIITEDAIPRQRKQNTQYRNRNIPNARYGEGRENIISGKEDEEEMTEERNSGGSGSRTLIAILVAIIVILIIILIWVIMELNKIKNVMYPNISEHLSPYPPSQVPMRRPNYAHHQVQKQQKDKIYQGGKYAASKKSKKSEIDECINRINERKKKKDEENDNDEKDETERVDDIDEDEIVDELGDIEKDDKTKEKRSKVDELLDDDDDEMVEIDYNDKNMEIDSNINNESESGFSLINDYSEDSKKTEKNEKNNKRERKARPKRRRIGAKSSIKLRPESTRVRSTGSNPNHGFDDVEKILEENADNDRINDDNPASF